MKKNVFCIALILMVILSLFSLPVSADEEALSISNKNINL